MTIRRNFLALIAVLWAVSCSTNSAIQRSEEYLAEGYVMQAFLEVDAERTQQMVEGRSVDPEIEAAWQSLRYRYLIQQARERIYSDHEQRGIDLATEAMDMHPGDEVAAALITRAKRKLAIRATTRGQDHLAKGEFEPALVAFDEAIGFLPGHKPALEGIEAVRLAVSRLHAEAQKQFIEAIRKLPQFRYSEVDWHATAALTRGPARHDAEQVQGKALKELALEAVQRAEQNKADKVYGAALMEYRTARDLSPQIPGVDDYIKQMEREVAAVQKTEAAQLAIQADRLDEAGALLDEAFELSTLERTTINELRLDARRRAGEIAYDKARDMELQGEKAEALAAFEELAKAWPDGLKDEQTRIGALRSDIEGAEKAYAAGEAAEAGGDLAGALDQFKTSRTYYGKFRDVDARIERLTKKLSEGGGSGS